ncbi:MAG: glycosyl transferase family 1 [Meiothermus sp.]
MLTTGLAYGGAETQLVRLATRLKARGWDVRVVSMLPPQAYVEELESAGIPVDSLGMRRGVPDPRAIFRLAGILRRERPLVLHSHMVHANLLARLARPLVRVPVLVCTAHNIIEGGRHRELAYRLTDPLCDITTQVSRAGLERYVKVGAVPAHKIRFVPNGVDTDRFQPDQDARNRLRKELGLGTEFAWLAVGRFEEAKDYPNMLRAFARVQKARPDARLLIAGQGPSRAEAEELVAKLGLTEVVRFLGVRKDIPELLNAADAYVMSSAWEGMPMVLLEASASGLPVVATHVGGNAEVVLDGQSGFLVPPKDPEALAGAMLRLMSLSPEAREAMGRAGRAHVEANYALDRVVDRWEALYKELLERKGIRV